MNIEATQTDSPQARNSSAARKAELVAKFDAISTWIATRSDDSRREAFGFKFNQNTTR